jgi:hypothetical protein
MQPTFLPWLGYFDLIDYVDHFVLLDTVQLSRQSWQTRNKLKVQNKSLLFSLPVSRQKPHTDVLIKDATIDCTRFDFRKKLAKTVHQSYSKSPCYDEIAALLDSILAVDTSSLADFNSASIKTICQTLDIRTPISRLSDTDFRSDAIKGRLVLDICEFMGADEYISPLGAKAYMEEEKAAFQQQLNDVQFQRYDHPAYPQQGDTFISHLCVFDLLFNVGSADALNLIRSGRDFECWE